jgi:formylglycine-generating enzyme required for sulfatase activity
VITAAPTDRAAFAAWYRRNRDRTRRLFDLIDPSAYYTRPIALRNPIAFYEGHLPAFSAIAFLERGLGRPAVDARLERLFARGIDPDSEESAVPRSGAATVWPSREEILAFAAAVDGAFVEALETAPLEEPGAREGLFTALEHEAMHQETLLYMWRRVGYELKRPAEAALLASGDAPAPPPIGAAAPRRASVRIPAGAATLGAARARVPFGWDNEFDEHVVDVAAFDIDVHDVTNGEYLAFVQAGGPVPAFWTRHEDGWRWRGMFEEIPLPLDWPVYVSHEAAAGYAQWKGRRLPTEAEYHRAAFATPSGGERLHPWGDEPADASRGNFDFASWEPVPVGSYPSGASAWGVQDLVGNGWEWTSTVFAPFDGFRPMPSYPEYSADFFDGEHYVMKGAAPATARELVRRSFRNWFRPNYPYVYAVFRTAR